MKLYSIGEALALIDKLLFDMTYTLEDAVEDISSIAGITVYEDDDLDTALIRAYDVIASRDPSYISDAIANIFEQYGDGAIEQYLHLEEAVDIEQTGIYTSFNSVLSFLKDNQQSEDVISSVEDFMKRLKKHNLNTLKIAYEASHSYFKYLKKELFGVITNSFYTVGHTISQREVDFEEYKSYEYVCHKDLNTLNAPRLDIAMFFKAADDGAVQVDFKLARTGYLSKNTVGVVGYMDTPTTVLLLPGDSDIELGKKLADECNRLAIKINEMARLEPSLLSYKN